MGNVAVNLLAGFGPSSGDESVIDDAFRRTAVLLEFAEQQLVSIGERLVQPQPQPQAVSAAVQRIALSFNHYFEGFDCRIAPEDVVVGRKHCHVDDNGLIGYLQYQESR
jgi:hypothetical protein